MFRGRDIVCFANDWSADPTSKHHLMRRIAEENRVLWVEAAGMRAPNLRQADDARRIVSKARKLFTASRPVLQQLHVYSPPVLPFPESRYARATNALLYRYTITRELQRLRFSPSPLLWSFTPHVEPLIRRLPRSSLIYHCVDRWSAFRQYNTALMERWEADICCAADLVLASAENLAERCRAYSERVYHVPHGVDVAHFATALQPGPLPVELRGIPEPRIGFFGLIHEWIDIALIKELATRTSYSFVLIGEARVPIKELSDLHNVHYLNRKPYESLPAYCRGFQAAIIPFKQNDLTRSVNPIKLREYAAAGLPVVSTDLPEVRRCGDIVACATDLDSWLRELSRAVRRGRDPGKRRTQSERVQNQDWSAVCRRISNIFNGVIP